MPKCKITDRDNTGSPQLNPITNVVYIPGKATEKTGAVLCSTPADLARIGEQYIGGDSTKPNKDYLKLVDDLSYRLAKRCLQLGMQVLYQGFPGTGNDTTWTKGEYITPIVEDKETGTKRITISGEEFTYDAVASKIVTVNEYGTTRTKQKLEFAISNGTVTIDSEYLFVGIPVDAEGQAQHQTIKFDYINNRVGYNFLGVKGGGIEIAQSDWMALADKALYDIRFLTTGAYPQGYADMVSCATKRGDCVALLDHSPDLKDVAKIRAAFSAVQSKYAAAFTPWFTSNVEEFGTSLIPPSFGYLFAYARSVQSNPDWYAVAGTFRGSIPELDKVEKDYSTAEVEMLQGRAADQEVELDGTGDNVGIAINPIAYVRGFGYLIWGNRTLIENKGSTKATSFLNVRNLCSDIVKTLYAAARKYTFEQNSNTLWLNFKYQIQPLLDRMVSGNGILSYTFEQLPATAKARLKARITITPIEGVEDFDLELVLEDSLEVIQ